MQYPDVHMSFVVSGSLSSHTVPSGNAAHMPVFESQTVHDVHPTVRQSPTFTSSKAKSPVKLAPEMYLMRRAVAFGAVANTVAVYQELSPRSPDLVHIGDQLVPSAELSRVAVPMVAPYMLYAKETP